jgi:hypothetical protein
MKTPFFALSLLAAVAIAPLSQGATIITPQQGGGADVRFQQRHESEEDREIPHDSEHAQLVSTTQKVKIEHGGEVLVTKRVFLGPDGQQFVKESRERVDR